MRRPGRSRSRRRGCGRRLARVAGFLAGLDLDPAPASIPTAIAVPGARRLVTARAGSPRPTGRAGLAGQARGGPRTGVTGRTTARTSPETCSATRSRRAFRVRDRRPLPHAARAWSAEEGGDELDSAAAWAVTVFPQPGSGRSSSTKRSSSLHPRINPLRHPPDRGLDSRRGLDRADRLVGLGARRARRDQSGGSAAGRAAPSGDAARDASRAGRCGDRRTRPRRRRSPGRTPSRSSRSGRATAESRRAGERRARPPPPGSRPRRSRGRCPARLRRVQLWIATTGRPSLRA